MDLRQTLKHGIEFVQIFAEVVEANCNFLSASASEFVEAGGSCSWCSLVPQGKTGLKLNKPYIEVALKFSRIINN